MNMLNFRLYFNNIYFKIYESLFPDARSEREVDLLARFIPSKDSPILDFGCAWGRHLKALAKLGYTNLTGVDFSDKLIEKAKETLKVFPFVKFVVTDFVSFESDQKFGLIFHVFQSFGHEDKNYDQTTINKAASLLAEDGAYLLDLRNPLTLFKNEKFDLPGNVEVDSFYNEQQKREKFVYHFDGQEEEVEFNVYTREELEEMFKKAGLETVGVYGDFEGNSFTKDSAIINILSLFPFPCLTHP